MTSISSWPCSLSVCSRQNVSNSEATVGEAHGVTGLLDIAVGDQHLSLRVWPAVDTDQAPSALLPATGKIARDWDVIASGVSADRTVYAVDLRGHGASDWLGTYSTGPPMLDPPGLSSLEGNATSSRANPS